MAKLYILLAFLFIAGAAEAQAVSTPQIPLIRKKFHDDIDFVQKEILKLDGVDDDKFAPSKDEAVNQRANEAATSRIDQFQQNVEADAALDANAKIKYLRGMYDVLAAYLSDARYRRIKQSMLPEVVTAYLDAMKNEVAGQSILPVIDKNELEVGAVIVRSFAFKENSGLKPSQDLLVLKDCQKHPEKTLSILLRNPDMPFADSLIQIAAKRNQEDIYNFAQAPNSLGSRIRKSNDPLVKIIARMARSKSGRQYFPFLDDLYKDKRTFEEVDSAMLDNVKYYKLLVATQINYAGRLAARDTPLVMKTLTNKLQQVGRDEFINEINGLHELSDERVRFKKLDPLSPEELYYLAVLQEEEIYTSSYTRGVYPAIFKRMKTPRGDTLLMHVYFDKFKKWIKMAANYNTLDNFLKTLYTTNEDKSINKLNAQILMRAFVRGLDRTNSLEDAVDVANSFASITDPDLKTLILEEVQKSLTEAKRSNNVRGVNIYSILNTLFLSMDPSNNIDVSTALGIPPVYTMPNASLKDTSGRIIIQQFFYGDKDGNTVFNSFLNNFSNANWRTKGEKDWVAVSSTKGVPITIYANRPLDENKGLDEQAQKNLDNYLADNNLNPTVVIHRGHSYYLNSTLKQLAPSAKVILLGSCGGYQSLNTVLNTCPYSQIISSKQTGSGLINQPMINVMVEKMREGKDLNWPDLWDNFSKMFKNNELFADYVPPHKNLGAVFIMAYNKLEE
ncbi:MAG: hypothetical protein J0I41_07105 [Filimonas sp.]|nr:hypothetical protein [Filimonas sp.]